jgi:hypothetical protein
MEKMLIMAAIWKTVRVFISSTFRDMHAKRDNLVRLVLPRLRELGLADELWFQAFDLRWCVAERTGQDDRTMRLRSINAQRRSTMTAIMTKEAV